MALPVNINELISGKTVEWERIEFKKGWNPLEVLHSICAFANDINNWGGGYIIVGIAEKDGRPILPPTGVQIGKVDSIQKELLGLCHKLRPQYFSIVEPIYYQGKMILILWVPGGATRPYKAPESLSKPYNYSYYIRRFSSTKKANDSEEKDLLVMSANIPYDDKIRQTADLTDLKPALIHNHLTQIGSDLASQASNMSLNELSRKMNIAEGPDEFLRPKKHWLTTF